MEEDILVVAVTEEVEVVVAEAEMAGVLHDATTAIRRDTSVAIASTLAPRVATTVARKVTSAVIALSHARSKAPRVVTIVTRLDTLLLAAPIARTTRRSCLPFVTPC